MNNSYNHLRTSALKLFQFAFRPLLTLLLLTCGLSAFAQPGFEMKLQLLDDAGTYGVYAKITDGTTISDNTDTGSGQATVVAPYGGIGDPNNFTFTNLTSVNGFWSQNARAEGPTEAPDKDYISFGFVTEGQNTIDYSSGEEVLMFTFVMTSPCPDTLYLMDGTDPFVKPNSAGTNPENDLAVIDKDQSPNETFYYVRNYALSAWSCQDCDLDGIPNALEDTNGNGIFDAGDESDLCDVCDPIHPESAVMTVPGDTVICEGDADVTNLVVTIEGGWPPYTVVYTDGTTNFTVPNYNSGDNILINQNFTATYSLVSVTDDKGCTADVATLSGDLEIIVEGPLVVNLQPTDEAICSATGVSFTSEIENQGDGDAAYQWQISTDNGTTFIDLIDGTPYSDVTTQTLVISDVLGLDDNLYRLKASTPSCDSVYSAAARLDEEGPVTFDSGAGGQPTDVVICEGDNTGFTSSASAPLGAVEQRWQVSTDGGATFVDISDVAPYNGTDSDNLTITGATSVPYNGYQYRMKVWTAVCDTLYSNAALLEIEGPVTIVDPVATFTGCSGEATALFVDITNPGAGDIIYQWQVNEGSGWTDLTNGDTYNGVRSDTLSISDVLGLEGNEYRVEVSTGTCSVQESGSTTLTVEGPIEITASPSDVTECGGNGTTFTGGANNQSAGGSLTQQWQLSNDDGATWIDIAEAGVYSDVSANTLVVSDVTGLDGTRYRMKGFTGSCDTIYTDLAILTVEGPITIDVQPSSTTECSGDAAFFSADVTVEGNGQATYRWELSIDNGSNWNPLANNGVYNGAGTTALSIGNVAGFDQYQYRLHIETPTCGDLYTTPVTLTVEGPLTLPDPVDVLICDDDTNPISTSFTSAVTNDNSGTLQYEWQLSTDGINFGAVPDNAVYDDVTTTTLNINDVTGLTGRMYRLGARTGTCDWIYSNFATLTVEGAITVDVQPVDAVDCAGLGVTFFANVNNGNGGDLNYQWQVGDAVGGPFTDIINGETYNGTTTDTLSLNEIEGLSGKYYRLEITNRICSTVFTDAALLSIEGPVFITAEPEDADICSGNGTSFTVEAVNEGEGTLAYTWEESSDDGTTWNTVTNVGVYSTATTNVLNISDVAGLSGNLYRTIVGTANCSADTTRHALLSVEGPISVSTQPADDAICSGESVKFNVVVDNQGTGDVLYQWQISIDDGANFFNAVNNNIYNGTRTDVLSISDVAGFNDYQYRVIVSTPNCSTEISDAATLTVEGPLDVVLQPRDTTVCSGSSTFFTAQVDNLGEGTRTYEWQISTDGLNFQSISTLANTAAYSDFTTPTLTINDVTGLGGRFYRLETRTSECNPIYTESGVLTVEGPIDILVHPRDTATCADLGVTFIVQAENQGSGNLFYEWEESTDGGATWNRIDNSNIYNGVSTDTLSIDLIGGLRGNMYHVIISTETCTQTISNPATIGVEGPVIITNDPDDVTVCSGSGTTFVVEANASGSGTLNYQWQVSANNGITWTDLTNTAPYQDVTTATLTITDVAGLGGYRYRSLVGTQSCEQQETQSARLSVEGPIAFDGPRDATVCSNIGSSFFSDVTNPGDGELVYQWYVSEDNGSSFNPILISNPNYRGQLTNFLEIQLAEGLDGNQYYLQVGSDFCANVDSPVGTLNVNDACDTGTCDFDLDGIINDLDPDDDGDRLPDAIEADMTARNISEGWNYVDDNGDPIHYDRCVADSDGDGILDDNEDPDGDGITNGEETDGDGINDGDPLDPCDPFISSETCVGVSLAIDVKLQGACMGVLGPINLMRDDLRERDLIPLEDPYRYTANFEHQGTEGGTEMTTAAVFAVDDLNDAIVDWVFIELRNALDPRTVLYTRSALVQRDGDVVDMDGVSDLVFTDAQAGSYFVSVRHRNHLGIMTAQAQALSPITTVVDFTDMATPVFGNAPMLEKNGEHLMWAGDANGNGQTAYQGPGNDVFTMLAPILSSSENDGDANFVLPGYRATDINLDGDTVYQGPDNDRNLILFQVTIPHPLNKLDNSGSSGSTNNSQEASALANYLVLQQLP